MKKTIKSRLFFVGELLFFLVLPCVLIWLQYGRVDVAWYKISVTGIVLLLLIFLLAKRLFLTPLINKINQQAAQVEMQQLSVTEPAAIESNKRKFRTLSMWQLFFNSIVPLAVFALALATLKAVEAGAIKMFGVMIICAVSMLLGVLCRIGEIYALRCEHEE